MIHRSTYLNMEVDPRIARPPASIPLHLLLRIFVVHRYPFSPRLSHRSSIVDVFRTVRVEYSRGVCKQGSVGMWCVVYGVVWCTINAMLRQWDFPPAPPLYSSSALFLFFPYFYPLFSSFILFLPLCSSPFLTLLLHSVSLDSSHPSRTYVPLLFRPPRTRQNPSIAAA